jgi:hypothetical protein
MALVAPDRPDGTEFSTGVQYFDVTRIPADFYPFARSPASVGAEARGPWHGRVGCQDPRKVDWLNK